MSTAHRVEYRRAAGTTPYLQAWIGPILGIGGFVALVAYWAAHKLTGADGGMSPFTLPFAQMAGDVADPGAGQWVVFVLLFAVPLGAAFALWWLVRRGRSKSRLDYRAAWMGGREDVEDFTVAGARAKTARLLELEDENAPLPPSETGYQIGRLITGARR